MERFTKINGKYIMITNADTKSGFSIVGAFAKCGANIIAHAVKPKEGFEESLKEIEKKYDVKIIPVYYVETDYDAMKALVRNLLKQKIMVDILVNNIEVATEDIFQIKSKEEIETLLETKLFAYMELTQMILKMMVRKRNGVIINTVKPESRLRACSTYDILEAALTAWTKTLAAETGKMQIRVNSLSVNKIGEENSIIENLVSMIVYLTSEKASFVNGQRIYI